MLSLPNQKDIYHGQAIYTKKSLPIYDLIVTKFSNRFAWRCTRKQLIHFFKKHTSKNHLDIGVGTGYFLEQLNLTPSDQRIGLLDLNKDCFDHIKNVLNPGGKLFGTTILGKEVKKNWLAVKLMKIYNKKKIFSNIHDDSKTLLDELKKRFSSVEVKINGCVAMFVAM